MNQEQFKNEIRRVRKNLCCTKKIGPKITCKAKFYTGITVASVTGEEDYPLIIKKTSISQELSEKPIDESIEENVNNLQIKSIKHSNLSYQGSYSEDSRIMKDQIKNIENYFYYIIYMRI